MFESVVCSIGIYFAIAAVHEVVKIYKTIKGGN